MIIPIRCFTCGKVIANKWEAFQRKVKELEGNSAHPPTDEPEFQNFERGFKGKVLDELGLHKICCRRHILGHVDLVDVI